MTLDRQDMIESIKRIIGNTCEPDIPFQEKVINKQEAAGKIVSLFDENKKESLVEISEALGFDLIEGGEENMSSYLPTEIQELVRHCEKDTLIDLLAEIYDDAQQCPLNDQERCWFTNEVMLKNNIFSRMGQDEVDSYNEGNHEV